MPADAIETLQEEIRQLKARLKASGLSSKQINQETEVLTKVQHLQALKAQLGADDPNRDENIQARLRQEEEQRHGQQKAQVQRERQEIEAVEAQVEPKPLVQRKIFHLLQTEGTGTTFHYAQPPRLNAKDTKFGEGDQPRPEVYITEKWDGTTMQATNAHIFRREDKWGKRKPGERLDDRYGLRLVAWRDNGEWRGLDFVEADRRVAEALRPHLASLARLEDGLCCYFEVVHTDVNRAFKDLPGFADIRVFDCSRAGTFLPFDEALALAARHGLPVVDYERRALDEEEIWREVLEAARSGRHYATAAAPLEGFVVREAGGGRIAKVRVEDLVRCGVPSLGPGPGQRGSRQGSLDLDHLSAIGLLSLATGKLHALKR